MLKIKRTHIRNISSVNLMIEISKLVLHLFINKKQL